jgi:hypothetical protein
VDLIGEEIREEVIALSLHSSDGQNTTETIQLESETIGPWSGRQGSGSTKSETLFVASLLRRPIDPLGDNHVIYMTQKSVANKIDIGVDETKYDSCNALVLDTTRKGSKTKAPNVPKVAKVLSKKQKKKLEKVLQRKTRKINVKTIVSFGLIVVLIDNWFDFLWHEKRAKLLSDLQDVRVEDKEMALMSSTSDVQTLGRKRFVIINSCFCV